MSRFERNLMWLAIILLTIEAAYREWWLWRLLR
jgi:hypothetical protein